MAFESNITFTQRSAVAAVDLSASQFFAVTVKSTGLDLAVAAKNIDGILQNNPISGVVGAFANSGVCKAAISASQTVTGGTTLFEVDTAGTLKVLAAGTAVAKALESLTSVAAVRIITVELLPSNAAFA